MIDHLNYIISIGMIPLFRHLIKIWGSPCQSEPLSHHLFKERRGEFGDKWVTSTPRRANETKMAAQTSALLERQRTVCNSCQRTSAHKPGETRSGVGGRNRGLRVTNRQFTIIWLHQPFHRKGHFLLEQRLRKHRRMTCSPTSMSCLFVVTRGKPKSLTAAG